MTLIYITLAIAVWLVFYLFYFQRKTPYGMLDFRAAMMLRFLPKDQDISIEKTRSLYNKLTDRKNKQDKIKLASIKDFRIPYGDSNIVCRSYDNHPQTVKPIIIYVHGGGWCIGSIATHERTCKKIAVATGYNVLSVEYSLAPEHPFPTAMNECSAVVEYVSENMDQFNGAQDALMIMGDSAGANLAFSAAINLLNKGKDLISRIIAIYPVVDSSAIETDSYNNFSKGYFLTKSMMKKFIDHYAPNVQDRTNPLVSPSYYENLEKLPPVYLITAQFDPLRDEGEAFAKQLTSAGVDCTFRRYDGVIHGFFANPMFGSKGDGAVNDVATYLHSLKKTAFASS